MLRVLSKVSRFLWARKWYWLPPLILALVLFVGLFALARHNSVGPFQYNY